MKRILVSVLFLFCLSTWATTPPDIKTALEHLKRFREAESRRLALRIDAMRRAEGTGVQPSQPLDVLHYDLDLKVDPSARTLRGTVTMSFSPTATLSQVKMRLHNALKVTGATKDGHAVTPSRKGADIIFHFAQPLSPGQTHEVSVSYSGSPVVVGSLGGGMMFATHEGVASATTLSEPFDSYAWWPCVDDVKDKATMDMHLTVPAGMVGASNGTLTSTVTNQDGTVTYTWDESYPIANYLISANVTNYAHFSDAYTSLDGATQMPLDYYVYPENESDARALFVRVPDMITYYAGLCGEYPFLTEKYGMVAFPWGGGMEHQTLTSMGDMYTWGTDDMDEIYAHELSHQWWGDDVTCATWDDIWLNEGFATYFEMLWLARHYGMTEGEVAFYYDDGLYNGALGGSVHLKNANKPFNDQGAVYNKGGWVLHMLKRVMGEDAFYAALRDYRAAHTGSNASTGDLKAACETRYGQDLTWFFDQWVYTPKRPIYAVSFSQTNGSVAVTVAQKQKHKIVNRATQQDVYIMPVDLTLHYADGSSETVTVQDDQRTQTFALPAAKSVTNVGFDEENWILKVVR